MINYIDDLINKFRHSNYQDCQSMLDKLDYSDSYLLSHLLSFINDENFHVRYWVCLALGNLGDLQSTEALASKLGYDDSYDVQGAAESSLIKLGKGVIPTLSKILQNSNVWGRCGAVVVLGRIGGIEAYNLLIIASNDEHVDVRDLASNILANLTEDNIFN